MVKKIVMFRESEVRLVKVRHTSAAGNELKICNRMMNQKFDVYNVKYRNEKLRNVNV